MSEPIERLSRFTPASSIDRDALLFAAGRAAARPNRRWHALCAALATTQLLMLGLVFWPRADVMQPDRSLPLVPVVKIVPRESPERPPPSLWQQRALAIASDGELPAAAPVANPMTSKRPLRAFGALPAALLN
jgi:hypothetical protein